MIKITVLLVILLQQIILKLPLEPIAENADIIDNYIPPKLVKLLIKYAEVVLVQLIFTIRRGG